MKLMLKINKDLKCPWCQGAMKQRPKGSRDATRFCCCECKFFAVIGSLYIYNKNLEGWNLQKILNHVGAGILKFIKTKKRGVSYTLYTRRAEEFIND